MRMRPIWTRIAMGVLGLGAAAFLFPFVWMVAFSIKPTSEIFTGSLNLLPSSLEGLANYTRALDMQPLMLFVANGLFVCAAILFFQILFAAPCAYALAKLRFRGREALFGLVLFGLLIPIQITSLPIYLMFSGVKILDSYTALIAPFTASVFGIFLFRQFFKTVPDDLINAARLDGLSEIDIVLRVVLPLTAPAATAFGIFSVVAHWNDLFWPLIVTRSQALYTPPLGILGFRSAEAGDSYGELMAATVIITAPLVLAFLMAQRRFIEGISMGALKG
ncbi:carbohydrate ABC transporter permease [Rhodoligotrophos appendicifer]|uniref:carbohydrate ABC transporter permease n=1 Tax=Rhodoligotrophos appendicifer TaxID=987056 RepID=UPI00117DA088|nr:carbohydrate ABC transporter permease [Rhodoligotrophos appendicifer]